MTTKSYLSQLKNTKSRVSFETRGITQPETNPLVCELLKLVSLRQTWGVGPGEKRHSQKRGGGTGMKKETWDQRKSKPVEEMH